MRSLIRYIYERKIVMRVAVSILGGIASTIVLAIVLPVMTLTRPVESNAISGNHIASNGTRSLVTCLTVRRLGVVAFQSMQSSIILATDNKGPLNDSAVPSWARHDCLPWIYESPCTDFVRETYGCGWPKPALLTSYYLSRGSNRFVPVDGIIVRKSISSPFRSLFGRKERLPWVVPVKLIGVGFVVDVGCHSLVWLVVILAVIRVRDVAIDRHPRRKSTGQHHGRERATTLGRTRRNL